MEDHANRIRRRGIGGCHAQAEQHNQELAEFADWGKHRIEKSTDIAARITCIPLRNQRRRYRRRRAQTLESDL